MPEPSVFNIAPQRQISPDAVVKQGRVLQHRGHMLAHHVHADPVNRRLIVIDHAAPRRIQADQNLHQGGFAAPARAHQGDLFAGLDAQVDAVQHIRVRMAALAVGKVEVFNLDPDRVLARKRVDDMRIMRFLIQLQQVIDATERGPRAIERILYV